MNIYGEMTKARGGEVLQGLGWLVRNTEVGEQMVPKVQSEKI